jgi:hypothetical protein
MRLPTLLAASAFAALLAQAPAQITIENFEPGEEVRHPLVLLKGSASANDLVVGLRWSEMNRFPVVDGKFRALVELKPGENMVLLHTGRQTVRFRLDYRPMKTPYVVRAIYAVAADEEPSYDTPHPVERHLVRERFDTALKLLQSFTADAMHEAGFGRKTFALEFDPEGKVVVHVFRHEKTGDELRKMEGGELWSDLNHRLLQRFSADTDKWCVLMGFTRYDRENARALAHTALGGGALGLFGSASMYTWPASVGEIHAVFSDPTPLDIGRGFDDSAGRGTRWGSASTTLGAVLHELGHTLGLPHSRDPHCIMSRGFDRLNRRFTLLEPPGRSGGRPSPFRPDEIARWSPYFALRLDWSPWLQPDGNNGGRFDASNGPRIEVDGDEVVVSAPHGIRIVGAEHDDRDPYYRLHKGQLPTRLRLDARELRREVANPPEVRVYVLDGQGNQAWHTLK